MTNFEKYKDELLQIIDNGSSPAFYKDTGISKCRGGCGRCLFKGHIAGCGNSLIKWLYEEYKEPAPKLTPKERAFCEAFESFEFYVARDYSDDLYMYEAEPWKGESVWDVNGENVAVRVENAFFKFIAWDDAKPWSIADLLELEVAND